MKVYNGICWLPLLLKTRVHPPVRRCIPLHSDHCSEFTAIVISVHCLRAPTIAPLHVSGRVDAASPAAGEETAGSFLPAGREEASSFGTPTSCLRGSDQSSCLYPIRLQHLDQSLFSNYSD